MKHRDSIGQTEREAAIPNWVLSPQIATTGHLTVVFCTHPESFSGPGVVNGISGDQLRGRVNRQLEAHSLERGILGSIRINTKSLTAATSFANARTLRQTSWTSRKPQLRVHLQILPAQNRFLASPRIYNNDKNDNFIAAPQKCPSITASSP